MPNANLKLFEIIKNPTDSWQEQIKECLDNGADINCVENQAYYTIISATPLMMAIDCRYDGITEYLIEQGADVNIKNKEGETALMIATNWGDLETAKLLIDNGADVNAKNKKGKTALDIAIENPHSIKLEENEALKDNVRFRNLIISNGGKRGIEIKPKAKAKTQSNDFGIGI